MRKRIFLFALSLVLIGNSLSAQMNRVEGDLLLQLKPGVQSAEIQKSYQNLGGAATGLTSGELLSKPMNIYRFRFNPDFSFQDQLLRALRNDQRVSIAQFNHYIQERCEEITDPQYGTQWHHNNDGVNGMTADADIDTDLAWDITRGGLTALGDTIVVCVIEGGNLNHPDLVGNKWINHQEIPDNGLDDDNNGYIDDHQGWNVQDENDEGIFFGGHGTQVMGMIGAKGNNELGVVGANWNIKIMSVAGESLNDEASVVEAYTYPLVMRQRYSETAGDSGAFVVATNASWGIDFGDPTDFPIWTAFYDTLGVYGILNCGATANNNVDIDVVNDIPTGVPSDYMVSVTATNSSDVRTFSAYGATTVDLGAPGANVFTTAGVDGYTFTSGTSFASPLTAGVIALLYSAPCQTFAEFVRNNPQEGADLVKAALFDGVDIVPNLVGQTVTGGRVNAFNSLMILMNDCEDEFICLPPSGFDYELAADTSYTLSWTTLSETASTSLRFRPVGTPEWTTLENLQVTTITIDTLQYCTDYEFEIGSSCDGGDETIYNNCLTLSTKGCCIAPEIVETPEIDENETIVSWSTNFNISSYNLFYRIEGSDEWILFENFASNDSIVLLNGLELCTNYEILVNPTCSEDPEFGTVIPFRTKGCGACLDNFYCESLGEDAEGEFINSIAIGDFEYESGNNGGYALFEDLEIVLNRNQEYEVLLTPGFTGQAWEEFFRIWIDLNQDGEFTAEEILLSSEEGSVEPVQDSILIPEDAALGATRMRISMKYVGGVFIPDDVAPCEIFSWGETEDYCITIQDVSNTIQEESSISDFSIYPNPARESFTLNLELNPAVSKDNLRMRIFDVSGKQVESLIVYEGANLIHVADLENGLYLINLTNDLNQVLKTGKIVKAD